MASLELFQRIINHIKFAPDCEDPGDYVLECIELAKELVEQEQEEAKLRD